MEVRVDGTAASVSPCTEHPLAFAVCTNQFNLVKLLVENGKALDTLDSNGNTLLHLCVIHRLAKMYEVIENMGFEKKLEMAQVLNKDGLTTLNLAANIGDKEMFEFIFERRRQLQWKCTLRRWCDVSELIRVQMAQCQATSTPLTKSTGSEGR